MNIIQMPEKAGASAPERKRNRPSKGRKVPKYIICLKHLYDRMSQGINELEALSLYGETCLHSTISTLANTHGIAFKRKMEPHQHQGGGITHFKRYWLCTPSQAQRLLKLYYPEVKLCL